jgi:CheY-like chemotaxis protein
VVAIIDDEASVLMAMRRVLGQQHEVHEFNAPAVALDQIPALNPEVIFCDVMMPDMSGGEFFRRLQVSAPRLAQRVIFMTGGAFSAAGRAFLGELTSPVLEKPFSAERVRRLASEQISKTRASG